MTLLLLGRLAAAEDATGRRYVFRRKCGFSIYPKERYRSEVSSRANARCFSPLWAIVRFPTAVSNRTQPDLYIVDILEYICEYADPGSLTVMARTTRAFHESAIRVLCNNFPSFTLFRCFPWFPGPKDDLRESSRSFEQQPS